MSFGTNRHFSAFADDGQMMPNLLFGCPVIIREVPAELAEFEFEDINLRVSDPGFFLTLSIVDEVSYLLLSFPFITNPFLLGSVLLRL